MYAYHLERFFISFCLALNHKYQAGMGPRYENLKLCSGDFLISQKSQPAVIKDPKFSVA